VLPYRLLLLSIVNCLKGIIENRVSFRIWALLTLVGHEFSLHLFLRSYSKDVLATNYGDTENTRRYVAGRREWNLQKRICTRGAYVFAASSWIRSPRALLRISSSLLSCSSGLMQVLAGF